MNDLNLSNAAALQARVEDQTKKIAELEAHCKGYWSHEKYEAAIARAEQAERERDEAVAKIEAERDAALNASKKETGE